jgi:hypothetical protein
MTSEHGRKQLLRSTPIDLRTVTPKMHTGVSTVETILAANESVSACAQAEKTFAELDAHKRRQIFCRSSHRHENLQQSSSPVTRIEDPAPASGAREGVAFNP